jgi:hypothetical protein
VLKIFSLRNGTNDVLTSIAKSSILKLSLIN